MTAAAASGTSTPVPDGPRPTLLSAAAILTWVTALLAILLPASNYLDRTFVSCGVALSNLTTPPTGTAYVDALKACIAGTGVTPADGSEVSRALSSGLLQSVISVLVLAALGWFVWKGRPLARWFLVAVWVISNLVAITPFGIVFAVQYAQLGIFGDAYLAILLIGVATLTVAAVFMNLPPVVRYLNERRPVRTAQSRPAGAGGLFGGMFGARSAPPARTPAAPTVDMTTSASADVARPAKSKVRSSQSNRPGGPPRSKRRG